jgi:hypothetical protein
MAKEKRKAGLAYPQKSMLYSISRCKQIVSSGSDKPLAYAQDKQQFDWLQVLKQRHQASPEQF